MGASLGLGLGPPDAGARFAGVQKFVRQPAPAAAADWSYQVDGGTWQRVDLVACRLVTDANVSNRTIALRIDDPDGFQLFAYEVPTAVAAGQTIDFSFAVGIALVGAGGTGRRVGPLPAVWLPAGCRVRAVTTGTQAGDQWTNVVLMVSELDRGPLGEQVGTDPNTAF